MAFDGGRLAPGAARDWCGTMPVHRRLLDSDPGYARAREEIETYTFGSAREEPPPLGLVTIPTIVHVVWSQAAQNVGDDQVASQLEALNRDFRKRNADLSVLPPVWVPLAADADIEFVLADVTRTRTDRATFDTDDGVKSTRTGGVDAVSTDTHLNLWVCQLGGGLLGYAQFPGGPTETDGVVVTHTAFGLSGTATAPFDLGRTLTHEVGHWLNLRHIWGDDGDGCGGDDFVADTPNQAGPNYGRPTYPKVSCDNAPHGDMFVNYMDYTDDAAMVMFTLGQAARMAAALRGPRSGLLAAAATS
ncbi:zinc metalloprotease [Asanoa sp. NPDC049518]|uniref:zinc metalloprotease n=1 Tax=unclassified Asanoa TaxID=2685164 RepID=UPI003419246E